jgi:Lon protease-like protein
MLHTPPDTLEVPNVLPIFPLPRVVLLPGEVLPLHVFEPRYVAMIRDAMATHKVIGMVEVTPGHEDEMPGSPPVEDVGCVGFIASHEELPDGRFLLFLLGVERFRIDKELDVDTLYRQVQVHYEPSEETAEGIAGVQALRQELRNLLPDLVELDDAARGQFMEHMDDVSDAQLIALASQILEVSSERKRELLEADSLADRFMMIYEDLYRHLERNPAIEGLEPDELN